MSVSDTVQILLPVRDTVVIWCVNITVEIILFEIYAANDHTSMILCKWWYAKKQPTMSEASEFIILFKCCNVNVEKKTPIYTPKSLSRHKRWTDKWPLDKEFLNNLPLWNFRGRRMLIFFIYLFMEIEAAWSIFCGSFTLLWWFEHTYIICKLPYCELLWHKLFLVLPPCHSCSTPYAAAAHTSWTDVCVPSCCLNVRLPERFRLLYG